MSYTLERKKLKDAEELSDLNSDTDKDEYLKKSRKIRAAETLNDDTSNDSEQSDNSLISTLPKVPEKHNYVKTKTTKNATVSQTGKSIIK